jgi:hypothetical protein
MGDDRFGLGVHLVALFGSLAGFVQLFCAYSHKLLLLLLDSISKLIRVYPVSTKKRIADIHYGNRLGILSEQLVIVEDIALSKRKRNLRLHGKQYIAGLFAQVTARFTVNCNGNHNLPII